MEQQRLKTVQVLLLVLCIAAVSGNSVTSKYSFVCNEDMSIDFIGIKTNGGGIALINETNAEVPCSDEHWNPRADENGVVNIPAKCIENNYTISRHVYVRVWDQNFNETFETPTTTSSSPTVTVANHTQDHPQTSQLSNILGGKHGYHQFNLTCNPLPESGLHEKTIHHFHESDIKPIPALQNEISQVDMYFMKEGTYNRTDQEISNIYVGEPFYLILKYHVSPSNYNIIPKKCTAYQGDDDRSDKNLELWNTALASCIGNEADEFIETFRKVTIGEVSAKMFGFRFMDSQYITIECDVIICRLNDRKCYTENQNCLGDPISSRKRRAGITETSKGQTDRVKRTFKVFDTQQLQQLNGVNTKYNAMLMSYIAAYLVILSW